MSIEDDTRVMFRLRDQGLAEMSATGQWQLTAKGREVWAEHQALYRLARALHRPGADRASSPRRQAPRGRQTGTGTPPSGSSGRGMTADRTGEDASGKATT